MKINIVDDDPRVRNVLQRYLVGEGFEITTFDSAEDFRRDVKLSDIDLVLIDLGLPGENGLGLIREIRNTDNVPIIIITGKDDPVERVVGLEIGADDYITKPFELREVLARIRAVLRRTSPDTDRSHGQAASSSSSSRHYRFDDMNLDMLRRELRGRDGVVIPLTSGELDLLVVLVENPNRVLSREQLLDKAHGREWSAFDRSADTQIARLRKKIEIDPTSPSLIKTVRGLGYIFTGQVERG